MAAQWQASDSYRTVQVLGPSSVQQVEEVGFIVQPWEVFARVAVDLGNWLEDRAASVIQPIADGIDIVMGWDEVAGMYFEQDVNASGLVVDQMVIVVQATAPGQYAPGALTGEVRVRTYQFAGQALDYFVSPPVQRELARLNALAAA